MESHRDIHSHRSVIMEGQKRLPPIPVVVLGRKETEKTKHEFKILMVICKSLRGRTRERERDRERECVCERMKVCLASADRYTRAFVCELQ
jgi:hypothetical protein